jgi:hypothetical protein
VAACLQHSTASASSSSSDSSAASVAVDQRAHLANRHHLIVA